ncbi:MAG: protein-(glutamine-N5) methyltransferase, release factor-specific [Sphingobacteriales bacterium 17-39-43]|uniref:peptide chain release factor N(5)-glutamine methyltransferase n=1 Tax=Daejeonella sp. TaxID=2805397 RepID=UPI000BC9205F|nr:peptide chain release factor N(5)-glutamine methyltransferase [Daejeonella sp.]OYZ32908.1 MAG: protein-(glutamine-N5) methyltransferase, release factor-specific [Sphingobacteriales bacterium 16-39-50]OZA26318.1 MAG: protein-(glutamine-N5) methyltransferase, release factor-specific [Sphingobacteriales bacterium 17-39-43]HQT23511.1 peptide chain release factor N(5)-glutamine methyltransferase [Daejeonella sp.]HQT56174.1 peptide chain release factor N(5)-glutamine methyltransferase [Daejeonella
MTFRETEQIYTDSLRLIYDRREAASLAWLSISHVCKLERAEYLNLKDTEIPTDKFQSLLKILEELKTGKPLQYVIGETEFYGMTFKVNPSVLIPRPETEELVEWILSDIRKSKISIEGLKIIDIGTGSGCIPISLKKNLPEAQLFALDISPEALGVSKQNAALNTTRIQFIQDDIRNSVSRELIGEKFGIIVSNPPYVTEAEKQQMLPNVLEHEPHLALFVPNDDPLIFYRAIADFAIKHTDTNGSLYLEINENLGEETVQLLKQMGFKNIELRQDLSGKDRMISSQIH